MKNRPILLSVLLLSLGIVLVSVFFYGKYMTMSPAYHHGWAMADYYAMAVRFRMEGYDLLHPATFNLETKDGITASDFPLPAWTTALAMGIAGSDNPLVFRLLTLLVSITGFFFFFRTLLEAGVSAHRSALLTFFFWLLPGLTYFHNSFMPSIWAISAWMIGFWALRRWMREQNRSEWLLALTLFTLAALIRKPFVLYLLPLALLLRFKKHRSEWMVLVAGMALFGAWQLWDRHLQMEYGSIFLRRFQTPGSVAEMLSLAGSFLQKWGLVWLSPAHVLWLIVGLVLFLTFKKWRNTDRQESLLIVGYGAMGAAYFLAMLRQFPDHDYYVIDSFLPFLLAGVSLQAVVVKPARWQQWLELALLPVAVYWAYGVLAVYRDPVKYGPAELSRQVYAESAPLLETLEIPDSARMLVLESHTTNLPLVLMHRRGYTSMITKQSEQERSLQVHPDFICCLDAFFVGEVVNDYPGIVKRLERVGNNADLLIFRPADKPGNTLEKILPGRWETVVDTSCQTSEEFVFTRVVPYKPGSKVLFHGYLTAEMADGIKPSVALLKDGVQLQILDQPFKPLEPGKKTYRSLQLQIADSPANELRFYLWNPQRKPVDFGQFRISVSAQ